MPDMGVLEKCSKTVFLLSPEHNQNLFFQGYLFIENHFIYGSGFEEYTKTYKKEIPAGKDGCYVITKKIGKKYLINTDYWGYKKIFYFWSDKYWAVSNSLTELINWLQAKDIKLTPRFSQISALLNTSGPFFNQLYSFRTIVNEIRLLPANKELHIGSELATEVERNCPNRIFPYTKALSVYLEIWTARLETLISNNINLSCELTGGLDSRATYAIARKAKTRLGNGNFNVLSHRQGSDDQKHGRQLSTYFGEPFNLKPTESRLRLNSLEKYNDWMYHSLGVYHPIYFNRFGNEPNNIIITGVSGENHRPFYDKSNKNYDKFIQKRITQIQPSFLQKEIENEIEETFDELLSTPKLSKLVLHYRNFRNRFHAGRRQNSIYFHPLGSSYLSNVYDAADPSRQNSAQILFDIMNSLEPSLLQFPFDVQEKSPNASNFSMLVTAKISDTPNPGRVFVGEPEKAQYSENETHHFEMLNLAFYNAIDNPYLRDLLPEDAALQARNIMKIAYEKKQFEHANDGIIISGIIATEQIL